MIEDFDKLKNAFFAEVKSFKDKVLDSFENVVDYPTDGSKIFTAHILEEVYFLRKQLKSKDEMINSLLNQLGKYHLLQLQQAINHHHSHHHCCHHFHHKYHHHYLYHCLCHHRQHRHCCHHKMQIFHQRLKKLKKKLKMILQKKK